MGFLDFLFGEKPKYHEPEFKYLPGQENVLSGYYDQVGKDMPWLFDTAKGSLDQKLEVGPFEGQKMDFKIGNQTINGSYNPRDMQKYGMDVDVASKNAYLEQSKLANLLSLYGKAFNQPAMTQGYTEQGSPGLISSLAPFALGLFGGGSSSAVMGNSAGRVGGGGLLGY